MLGRHHHQLQLTRDVFLGHGVSFRMGREATLGADADPGDNLLSLWLIEETWGYILVEGFLDGTLLVTSRNNVGSIMDLLLQIFDVFKLSETLRLSLASHLGG